MFGIKDSTTFFHSKAPIRNGQAKVINKTLLNILKKTLEEIKGKWAELLPLVL